jgi:hypothetical protein
MEVLLNIENVKRERGNNTRENIRATLFPLDIFHFIDEFIYTINLLAVII